MRGSSSFIAGLTIGFVLAVTGPAAAENVLRWVSAGGAATADPHALDALSSVAQFVQFYEQLIQYDSNLVLAPQLALAWRLVEPTAWEFELRPNVRFHDGTPFTAADVVFSSHAPRPSCPGAWPLS
jgi:peptide/nickel transport system substrate-binding protein